MPGMRAELEVSTPGDCPVAKLSRSVEGSISSISRAGDTSDGVVEQFTAPNELAASGEDCSQLFEYRSASVYQVEHDVRDCLCSAVERAGHPIANVRAEDGSLAIALHLTEIEALRDLVADLREEFGDVKIRYLLQVDSDEEGADDVVPIDRNRLTDRQQEVLETAYQMGYFAYPREANATEVAAALDIDSSTFTEHLAAAQSKLMDELLTAP
ncbi:helix-turn-helix domain-containing protein [Halococcoides cellulosivorans]|uniref:Bacterio-opsin activator n=1 Tax=Halococcoides cellulosivorans TaxID=1679096 RepID=A0A2R4X1V2_9EURY|nr:helix-turn-helix domain-containing protein [Halococcoides cellulosivorans]AWB27703.1 bacterio-opsin activator [Halococcoides cellulosivorans]